MSRSHKKKPFTGITTARSEKDDKKIAHSKLRQRLKRELRKGEEGVLDVDKKDTSDPWGMAKDGKFRFDPKKHPKMMRK